MANVILLPNPSAATPTLDQYGHLLNAHPLKLVPVDILAAMRSEIEASVKPARHWEVQTAIAALQASLKIPGTIDDPDAFSDAMAIEVAERGYSVDVLQEAVREARRTLDWFPSIREILEICDKLKMQQRQPLRIISAMEATHKQRRHDEQEAEQKAKREAEHLAALKCLEAAAIAKFGDDGPSPGDIELADSISSSGVQRAGMRVQWTMALVGGELWAAKFCRLMALAERTRRASEQGRIFWNECLAIGKLISRDEAAARSAIEKAEASTSFRAYADQPPESFWDALWRIHKICGLDVPRSKDADAVAAAAENLKHLKGLQELADVRGILDQQTRAPGPGRAPGPYRRCCCLAPHEEKKP